MLRIAESELILNPDGSIYHLKLKPGNIADTIIIVGDPNRVRMISKHFDHIECHIENREFFTHTGTIGNKRLSVMSTGIGVDNIDIVINELDAIVNIDLETRKVKQHLTSLNIIRLGTSGSLQKDIPVDSLVLSTYGLGIDGLLNFYLENGIIADETKISAALIRHTGWDGRLARPYIVKASDKLIGLLGDGLYKGITATAPGFYGPQGRVLRLPVAHPDLNDKLTTFNYKGERIMNYEMETSALYGLGKLLGHQCCTICSVVANRLAGSYSKDYNKTVEEMIRLVLNRLGSN